MFNVSQNCFTSISSSNYKNSEAVEPVFLFNEKSRLRYAKELAQRTTVSVGFPLQYIKILRGEGRRQIWPTSNFAYTPLE